MSKFKSKLKLKRSKRKKHTKRKKRSRRRSSKKSKIKGLFVITLITASVAIAFSSITGFIPLFQPTTTTTTTTTVPTTTTTTVPTTTTTTTTTLPKPTTLNCKLQLSRDDIKSVIGVDYIYGRCVGCETSVGTTGGVKCYRLYVPNPGLDKNVYLTIYKYNDASSADNQFNDECKNYGSFDGFGEKGCNGVDIEDHTFLVFTKDVYVAVLEVQRNINFDQLKSLAEIVDTRI